MKVTDVTAGVDSSTRVAITFIIEQTERRASYSADTTEQNKSSRRILKIGTGEAASRGQRGYDGTYCSIQTFFTPLGVREPQVPACQSIQ